MSLNERVYKILAEAATDAVQGNPGQEQPSVGPDLLLVGKDSQLDSLGLVSLIVTAETKIMDEFGVSVALVDGAVMDSQESKFHTLENLADHVTELLKAQGIDDE
jgi:acyl carrier protein